MRILRYTVAALTGLALCSSSVVPAGAQNTAPIKIALITDMSGIYSAISGPGAVAATQMAIDDFGGKVLGRPIVLDVVDHRNNGPLAASKAREEFDNGADLALDLTNSATALAVDAVATEKHKLEIVTGGGSSALTNASCSKYEYHYAYDTYAMAHVTGASVAKAGGKTWYAFVANYAFGQQMLKDFTNAIKPYGGDVTHADMIPLGTSDFSSYALAARNSHDQVLGLFNAGDDTINSMKAAQQFGLTKDMKIAVGLAFLSDVDALPDVFANARITDSWYWDQDKQARAWADRFTAKFGQGRRPTSVQAADYSATMQWLEAVKATGTTDADKIVAYLDGRKFNDFYARNAEWRGRDHLVVHDMLFVQVLPKDQVKEPHAWFKILERIPGKDAFQTESETTCKKDW